MDFWMNIKRNSIVSTNLNENSDFIRAITKDVAAYKNDERELFLLNIRNKEESHRLRLYKDELNSAVLLAITGANSNLNTILQFHSVGYLQYKPMMYRL
jgi:hypothetical protein